MCIIVCCYRAVDIVLPRGDANFVADDPGAVFQPPFHPASLDLIGILQPAIRKGHAQLRDLLAPRFRASQRCGARSEFSLNHVCPSWDQRLGERASLASPGSIPIRLTRTTPGPEQPGTGELGRTSEAERKGQD